MKDSRKTTQIMSAGKLCLIIMISIISGQLNIQAQNQGTISLTKKYRAWISLYDAPKEAKGFLLKAHHNSVTLAIPREKNVSDVTYDELSFDVEDIISISLRKRSNVGKGFGIGFACGVGVAMIAGLVSGDDESGWVRFTGPQKGLMMSPPIGLLGGIIGAAIGSAKIRIPINGNKDTYRSRKSELDRYSIRK